jgi:glycosyltransferase involved in cell wall biosynthesis
MSASKPLVSIVIPSHERPDYLALAIRSAQAQTYENLQIIISDNSVVHDPLPTIQPLIVHDPRVQFHKQLGGNYMENWLNALKQARGEYTAFLMDDDLFHPNKVERMLQYFMRYPSVSLVTSFRELIDAEGQPLPPMKGTQRLFEQDAVLEGRSFGEMILRSGMNLIGEPTTAMFRTADVGAAFGRFCDRQYAVLADLSTWMELLPGRHCVYIAEALSYFRIHGGQDQRKKSTAINANQEWLQMLIDGHRTGKFFADGDAFRELLASKLAGTLPFLVSQYQEIRDGNYDPERTQLLVRTALQWLLQSPAGAKK